MLNGQIHSRPANMHEIRESRPTTRIGNDWHRCELLGRFVFAWLVRPPGIGMKLPVGIGVGLCWIGGNSTIRVRVLQGAF